MNNQPNANDWPYDNLTVGIFRWDARSALTQLANNQPVTGEAAGLLITALQEQLKQHNDPNYTPQAKPFHSEDVDIHDKVIVTDGWQLEDRFGKNWFGEDAWILRAWVENVNSGASTDSVTGNTVPDSYLQTDWSLWRKGRTNS